MMKKLCTLVEKLNIGNVDDLANLVQIKPIVKETPRKKIIVVDTNIFMGSLDEMERVNTLLKKNQDTNTKPTEVQQQKVLYEIVIPMEVIRELDGLKKSSVEEKHIAARNATHFIMECLQDAPKDILASKRSGYFRGQQIDEIVKFRGEARAINADENILYCALYFHSKGDETILLTDDKNLKIKAMSNGIAVPSTRDFYKMLTVQFDNGIASQSQSKNKKKSPNNKKRSVSPPNRSKPTFTFDASSLCVI
jgi:predicted ribonuclease YlaK